MNPYVSLILGLVSAAIGGDLFIRGIVGLAHRTGVSSGIIGLTVAAFATSSPELSVSINAAISGTPQIALGDAIGSNVVNIGLVLAIALTISGIPASRAGIRRDFPIAISIPIITAILAADGMIARVDGAILIAIFILWTVAIMREADRQRRRNSGTASGRTLPFTILQILLGLILLVAAGRLIVFGAELIAISYGISEFVVGATIVAIGTSTPELATTVLAKIRGEEEIGLGTILGSNIFNGAMIVGIAALIRPIPVSFTPLAFSLMFGLLTLTFIFPTREGMITKGRGLLLLFFFAMYLVITVAMGPQTP